jgi:putative ABC transport system substrate-binding protein
MRRREFIAALGGVAALPLAVRAQQAMPVIGFISARALASDAHLVAAFRQGLAETGHVEGQNVAVEYRWAEGRSDQAAAFAAELVRQRVSVVFVGGGDGEVKVVRNAVSSIPVVFAVGGDPVADGLVASVNRPGGNATGISNMTAALWPKRLELLRELIPPSTKLALFVSPSHPSAEPTVLEVQAAARPLGQQVEATRIASERELEPALAKLAQQRIGGLLVMNAPVFFSNRERLAALAARHAIPTIYDRHEFALAGGLLSYGASTKDQYRQSGIYAGRILKGAKPADLPVMQPTIFELVLNLKAAKALGLTVPSLLIARADEVIE